MAKFFFHMANGREQLDDENGKELRDLSAAHEHALHLIHRAMSCLTAGQTNGWMIKVATATGRVPLTVLFPKLFRPAAGKSSAIASFLRRGVTLPRSG